MDSDYRVLDLFCGLGGFSQAFAESDRWVVTTVDIEDRFDPDITADVFDLRPSDFEHDYDVVLAGVPCTVFTPARNMTTGGDPAWDGDTPNTDEARDLVALAYHTLGLIRGLAPDYWFVENPTGRLSTLIGRPEAIVTQCQYGRPYQKPTGLWGDHPQMEYRRCSAGDSCHTGGSYAEGETDGKVGVLAEHDTSEERAALPYELSADIRDACERALDGDATEQATLF
jgi:hypothetical protein